MVPRALAPEGVLPPGFGLGWTIGPASRPAEAARGGESYYDPAGGEWRYFPGDRWHFPHWDYNPHDAPRSEWRNGPLRPGEPINR